MFTIIMRMYSPVLQLVNCKYVFFKNFLVILWLLYSQFFAVFELKACKVGLVFAVTVLYLKRINLKVILNICPSL